MDLSFLQIMKLSCHGMHRIPETFDVASGIHHPKRANSDMTKMHVFAIIKDGNDQTYSSYNADNSSPVVSARLYLSI